MSIFDSGQFVAVMTYFVSRIVRPAEWITYSYDMCIAVQTDTLGGYLDYITNLVVVHARCPRLTRPPFCPSVISPNCPHMETSVAYSQPKLITPSNAPVVLVIDVACRLGGARCRRTDPGAS